VEKYIIAYIYNLAPASKRLTAYSPLSQVAYLIERLKVKVLEKSFWEISPENVSLSALK